MGRNAFNFNWIIIIPLIFLPLIGLLTIASTTPDVFVSQCVFVGIGLLSFFLLSRVDCRVFDQYWVVWYGLSLLFLLITFLGPEIRGSTRWLVFGGVRIQPSELIKPLMIATFASFFSRYPAEKLRNVAIGLILFLIPAVFLFKQPDLGNTVVYGLFFLGIILVSGISAKMVAAAGIFGAILFPFSWRFLQEYQRLRLITFLTPSYDPQGAGYNALQSIIAVGSGGVWGRGFGRGIQSHLRFLPEYHTDFIFASFLEEFGLVGGVVLFVLVFVILWTVLQEAHRHEPNSFGRLFCTGLFMQLFVQVVINIGMNIGIVPITGITLPLVSYGGSSIAATCIGLGMFLSLTAQRKTESTLAVT